MGNIAGDCAEYRELLLKTQVLHNLLQAVTTELSIPQPNFDFIRKSAYFLRNLYEEGTPKWADVTPSIPIFSLLVKVDDEKTLAHVTWSLLRLASNPNMVASDLSWFLTPMKNIIGGSSNKHIKSYCHSFVIKVEEALSPKK